MAVVAIHIELVSLVDIPAQHASHIIETCLSVPVSTLFRNMFQHPVAVGRTSAHEEGDVFGNNWYFEIGLAGDESYAGRTVKLLPVGIAVVDVHHRRDAPAITRWETAFI